MLDEILSRQISPFDKIWLGYENSLKTTSSSEVKTKLSVKGDKWISRNCNEELQEHNISSWNRRSEFRKIERPRKSPLIRYGNIFVGHCYACRNFGHKEIHCKAYARNNYMRNINDYGYPKIIMPMVYLLKGLLIETTIHSFQWWIRTLYVTNEIILGQRHEFAKIWKKMLLS